VFTSLRKCDEGGSVIAATIVTRTNAVCEVAVALASVLVADVIEIELFPE